MPMDRSRYPADWEAIALSIKTQANWICRHCGKQCLQPGDDRSRLTPSFIGQNTLTVHHADFTPENNEPGNLIPLCAPCHLRAHTPKKSNVSPGQLSLELIL